MADLDSVARELDQRAVQVELAGAHLVRAAAQALWTSIAADAFRARVDHRRRECEFLAEMLRDAAGEVRRFGATASAEKERLRRLEVAAEHAAARAAHGLVSLVRL